MRSSDVSPLSSIEKLPTALSKSVVASVSSTTRSRSGASSPARPIASSSIVIAACPYAANRSGDSPNSRR